MPSAVIGALRVNLDLGTAGWSSGLASAQKDAQKAKASFESVGAGITKAGAALSIGVTAPFVALLRTAIPAATESAQAMGQVEAALKSMGPVAGRTKDQLADAATELMHLSTFDDDEILRKVTANLLTFGTVAGEQFDRAQKAAVDLSTRMSGDLQGATLLVGKALNDPIKGMGALRKVGIQLTDTQRDQVKAFVEAGNAAGAQGIILTELERQFGGSAKAMRDATPGADLKNNWDDFTETVGGLALRVLPPLTDILSKVLGLFLQLSPTTQTMAVGAVAILAAVGPLATGLGLIVSAAGALIPLLVSTAAGSAATAAGLTAVEAAAVPLLAGAIPVLAAVAGAVALAYAAWENWDTIGPMLGDWAAGVAERTGEAIKWLGDLYDQVVRLADHGTLDKPVISDESATATETNGQRITAAIKQYISDEIGKAKADLASLDASFRAAGKWADDVDASAVRIWQSFVQMHTRVQAAFTAMVDGVTSAVRGKLGGAMDWVSDKARAVGDAFYTLYDRVVGHSYVPDLVDGIAEHMARLDREMVDPADKATKKVADSYRKLRDDLRPLLDEIFPEERARVDRADKLALIERAAKAGPTNGGLSAEQAEEARRRVQLGPEALERINDREDPFADALKPLKIGIDEAGSGLPELAKVTKQTTSQMVESFAGMSRDVLGSLRGMVASFKGGDILGGLTGLLDIVTQVAGLFGKGGAFAPRIAAAPAPIPYGGGRALGGPVVPGKRYRVGEKGPEWLEVGAAGRVLPNGGDGGGRSVTNVFNGNLLTPEFWAEIGARDDNAAVRGAQGGAQIAQSQSAYSRGRMLG